MNETHTSSRQITSVMLAFALATAGVAACSSSNSEANPSAVDAGTGEGGSPEVLGDADYSYLDATDTLTASIDTADCKLITQLLSDYPTYFEAMTSTRLRDLASSRFKPVLDFMSHKLCNDFGIAGDIEAYKSEAKANSPAGEFLNGTPLLQALVDESSDLQTLLNAENNKRSAEGLDPIIVADYPNSITSNTSTIVFFPGWSGRPKLDQWLQVQRTLQQLFFVTLEPRGDGTYATFTHSRALTTSNGTSTVGTSVTNQGGSCLMCHYSGKALHMRALDSGKDADKVATLVHYLQAYPPNTNHPVYNPFPDSPGIGTGGALTIEEASTYAGRTLTDTELATLNQNTACDSCHNGTTQNPLRAPFGQTVQFLTGNGIMPPGRGIVDATARTEAIKVLTAAYKVKLNNYFVGK